MHISGTTQRFALLAATAVPIILFATGCQPAPPVPTDAQDSCPLPPATFAGWFQSGSVALNGVVNPADSLVNLTPNCGFYAWSEQMFLWATSPAPPSYGGGAHIFDSPGFYDVSPPDASGNRTLLAHGPSFLRSFPLRAAQRGPHGLPVVADRSGKLLEFRPVDAKLQATVRDPSGRTVAVAHARMVNGQALLLDSEGRTIQAQHVSTLVPSTEPRAAASVAQKFVIDGVSIFLDPSLAIIDVEQGQAGDSSVLEAQTAANGSLVYYETMVNDVFAYFLTGVKNGAITTTTPNQFPTTAADLAAIVAYATAHGKGTPPFPDPNALAVELKSSWVEAAGLPNLSGYITTTATIPTYDKTNPNNWTPTGQKTTQLALVGLHVVGSTAGHPEMVWATFEHVNNTPPAAYSYNSTSGLKTVPQSTAGTWLFSASGSAGPFNAAHMFFAGPPGNNIQSEASFTISPSDTLRTDPWGIDGSNAASNTEVISMNSHVRTMLAAGDIRGNYIMTGATWTPFGLPPSGPTPGVGTNRLANTTMETYQQGFSNCFSCHQNGLNPDGLSHIYGGTQPLF